MSEQQVVITIDDQHLAMIEDVAVELQAAGLSVDQVNPRSGTIIGAVSADRRSDLDRVRGVALIRPARGFRIAPPEAGTQ